MAPVFDPRRLKVLAIGPYADLFIGDQLTSVSRQVAQLSVLIPVPRFASLASALPGGSERFRSLKRASDSQRGDLRERIITAKYLTVPGAFRHRRSYASASRSSVGAVSRSGFSPDIVHAHFIGIGGFVGVAVKSALGKPLVVSAYGGDAYSLPFRNSENREIAESIIQGADKVIAVSSHVAEKVAVLGATKEKIAVIPTGFDASLFGPTDWAKARVSLGLSTERKILLTTANLVGQKGHRYLLDGMKAIVKERKDVLLVLVGGGGLEAELRQTADSLGLQDNVMFAGRRDHREIPVWLNACDLFVLPSVNEGSPTVLTEAMACGKPVVATTVGGIPDLVAEGVTGLLCPPGDGGALASKVLNALDINWDRGRILERAKGYTWDALASRIVEVYRQALKV